MTTYSEHEQRQLDIASGNELDRRQHRTPYQVEPTEEEFMVARKHAQYEGDTGEDAYQVCRWFRGQTYNYERAERWLIAKRLKKLWL